MAKPAIGFERDVRIGEDTEAVNKMFTPEFRNRLDAIIGFDHLDRDVVKNVVQKFIYRLESQLSERNVTINLTEDAQNWLAEKGYDKAMGARPLARLIADKIKKPLAEEVLFGRLSKGGSVTIGVDDDTLTFKYSTSKPKGKAKASAGDDGELVG